MPNFEVVVIPAPAWAAAIQFLPGGSITADNVQEALEQVLTLAGGDAYYVHNQDAPSAAWVYEHGLVKNPRVTVIGSDGAVWEPDVSYPEENVSVRLDFGGAMSGRAFNS